ncbi:hypothetical protein V2W45_1331184 [Cenococcum geophilum]
MTRMVKITRKISIGIKIIVKSLGEVVKGDKASNANDKANEVNKAGEADNQPISHKLDNRNNGSNKDNEDNKELPLLKALKEELKQLDNTNYISNTSVSKGSKSLQPRNSAEEYNYNDNNEDGKNVIDKGKAENYNNRSDDSGDTDNDGARDGDSSDGNSSDGNSSDSDKGNEAHGCTGRQGSLAPRSHPYIKPLYKEASNRTYNKDKDGNSGGVSNN